MTPVADAIRVVLNHAAPRAAEITPLTSSTLGQVLAEDLRADLDSPPFAKALMDGFAVRSADLVGGVGEFALAPETAAGDGPGAELSAGHAAPTNTGAPLPPGADAVVKVELSEVNGGRVSLRDPAVAAGKNVLARAGEFRAGDVVIPKGTVMGSVAFGLSAAVGRTAIRTVPPARVAVLVTGNELVEANTKPQGGQIRNTNGPMLVALCVKAGALPRYLGIGRDDPAILASLVKEALLTADVLVMSGGVSVGQHDHTPNVLKSLGVKLHFHTVLMKPGKPLVFGTAPPGKDGRERLVFGLPGNPVSSAVTFALFVRPALRQIAGLTPGPERHELPLTCGLTVTNDRPTYQPARLTSGGLAVGPLNWAGSADLRAMLPADCMIELPAGPVDLPAGALVTVIEL